jgi:hypothetical protein
MTDEIRENAERAIRRLQEIGHPEHAKHLERALSTRIAEVFPLALREALQTVLTAIEALDPTTEMLLEQLRAKVDALLTPQHPEESSDGSDKSGGKQGA